MRRSWAILITVALTFATAIPAGAEKPDCDVDLTHPSCDRTSGGNETSEGGTTCVANGADYVAEEGSSISIPAQSPGFYCVDVSDVEAGLWTVNVDISQGTLRELLVIVRDSVAPGDLCAGVRFRKNFMPDQFSLDVGYGSYVNACGTEFAELIGGEDVWTKTGDPHPLALLIFVRGTSDLLAAFDVDISEATP